MQVTAFRQAALVLVKLDRTTRDAVLDRMPADQATMIRDALMTLNEDDACVQAAVHSFLSLRSGHAVPEFHAETSGYSSSAMAKSTVFRDDIDGLSNSMRDLMSHSNKSIAGFIVHERATTIAALLSSMPGNRAAEILKLLSSPMRIRILAILDYGFHANSKVVDVVAEWICDRLAESRVVPEVNVGQRDALKAIFHEFDQDERQEMLADLAAENPLLAERLAEECPSVTARSRECYC